MASLPTIHAQWAVTEQENAAWWAAQARLYALDYRTASERSSAMAPHFLSNALSAQQYAQHAAGMARYWLGFDAFPRVL